MSLRSAYANVFTPIPDASGNFTGQINQNLPGNLYIGSNGQDFKIYINGVELSGTGGGGGGGDISNWATQTANAPVNMGTFNVYNFSSLNAMPVTITTGNNLNSYSGSNIFAIGKDVDITFSNDTVILYAFGPSAAKGNSSNHVFSFGLNSAYRNSGNNLFAAGIDAATSNNGGNVIAIGNSAAYQNMSDNVIAIGVSAAYGNRSSDVIAIGRQAGYDNSGNYSIFLGTNPNTNFSNNGDYRFLVYSSNQGKPFMFGDLKENRLCINGSEFISNYNFTVDGRTYLNGTTKISDVIIVESGILQVSGRTLFLSNVENLGIVSMSNNLNVSGLTTLSGTNIQNRLNVSGLATLSGANIQNRLGIGISNPTHVLDVCGNQTVVRVTNSNYGGIHFNSAWSGASNALGHFIGRGGVDSNKNQLIIHADSTVPDSAVNFLTNGAVSRMYISSSLGRVGIGTSNPQSSLHVAGAVRVSSGRGSGLIDLGSNGTYNRCGYIYHDGSGSYLSIANQENGNMTFDTNNVTRMAILSNGNVGIGTTNPETKLQVNGAWPQVDIRGTATDVGLRLSNGATNGRNYTIAASATGSGVGNNGLYIQDNTAGATRLFIDSLGNLGIGRTLPNAQLDVSGSTRNIITSSIGSSIACTKATSNSALGTNQSVTEFLVDSNPDGFGGNTYQEMKYVYPVASGSTRGTVILAQQTYTKDNGGIKAGDVRFNHTVTVGENLAVTGGATVGGTLGVTGGATVGGTLGVTGGATVGGTLGVSNNTTVGGSLSVTGKISGKGSFFYGMISIWYGNVADIPAFCPGWQLCDGTNNTPDLRDRFVVGAGLNYARYATGGSTTQTFNYATNCWASGACSGDAFLISPITVNKLPPYFALCYIMYLG